MKLNILNFNLFIACKGHIIYGKQALKATLVFLLFLSTLNLASFSQTISYISPDIGSSGHNTYVEIIGPYNQNSNFGSDGIYLNNPGDAVRVVCANNTDTNKIKIGPLVVSWNGKLISTQVFVMPGLNPNSTNWQQLSAAFKIPVQVILNGTNVSNSDTFYIVQPQPALLTSSSGALGSGGIWGIRSRRGAMIFDSLIFQSGAVVTASTFDCDPATAGNQGYLPVHVLSNGRTYIDNGVTISLDAPGGENTNGGPGGGGGGTESFTNCSPGAGGVNQSGDGFTGGGTELLFNEKPGGGSGSTPPSCTSPGHGGISLNGVPGGSGWLTCGLDEGGGGGGTGHPFGTSGGRDGQPGGYGGGAGFSGYGGGGYASDGTTPGTVENGKANGNSQTVPFAGGSAGGAGVAGPGTTKGGGGGGGGAITLHAFLSSALNTTAIISADGGDGVIGCGGYRGGGGGSGGGVLLTGKLSSQGSGTISLNGGAGGVGGGGSGGQGGAGRTRIDGPYATQPAIIPVPGANSSSAYNGPSTDTTNMVDRSFNLTGTGNGQPIRIYLKPVTKPWQLVATVTGYGTSWVQNIVLPCPDTSFLLAAAQQIPAPSNTQYTPEPQWIFSQAAANFLIVKNPLKAYAGDDTTVCPSFCLSLGATPAASGGVPPYTYSWQPSTGLNDSSLSNPIVCLFTTTSYTLTVTDSSGCFYRDTVDLSTYPKPIAAFSSNDICLGDSISFTDFSNVSAGSITSWNWDFGNNSPASSLQHPQHKYTAAGIYTVTLIVSTNNGCKDTITKSVTVHALPSALFTASNICHGNQALFTESSIIAAGDTLHTWQWNFGDGSPLLNQQQVTGGHLFSNTGTYNVKLIVGSTFGCYDSVSHPVIVHPKPVAHFGSTTVCHGTPTNFTDSSITASGNINSWNWNFGDNTINGFLPNLPHLYLNAGNYSATLTVTNNFGCADTITNPVKVYFNPVAHFSVQDVCLNDSAFFSDSSFVDTSASIASYLWVFGDGTPTSGIHNPAHFYSNPGLYSVTLLVTTNQLCSAVANKQVNVFDPPLAAFTVSDVCLFDSAAFVNLSTNPSTGTIASLLWNFGDGSPLNNTSLNPHHLYSASGTYQISLITRSSNLACADTLTDSVTVFPMPIAAFSAQDVCLEQGVNLANFSSVSGSNAIIGWGWDFGDGGTGITQSPTHIYDAIGQYTITLVATTNNGCKDTITHTAIVHPRPSPGFTVNNICLGDYAVFTDQSLIAPGITNDALFSWNWDFGDGSTFVNNQNTTHLYNTIGTYTVELKVVSDFGCADSVSQTVVVNPNPVAIFSANDTAGCEPLCITFTEASTISTGTNVTWQWFLGDGETTTNSGAFNYCYTNDSIFTANQFTVSLTVTSDSGCSSTITKTNHITAYPLPVSDFSVSPTSATITYPVITIANLSTGANFWSWDFGDADTSSLQEPPAHTYADTGSYLLSLITTTQYGCADTSYQTIAIEPDFMFYVPSAFSPNGDGVNDTFIGKGMFIYELEMTIFDRWGNLIYRTDDINKPWDGKANHGNERAQTDVYIYSFKVTDFRMNKHIYKGTVTLVN